MLFHRPELFKRYLISSASNRWDDHILFRYEQAYFDGHDDLDAKVFMSYGSLESGGSIENMHEMEALLLSRAYPNLELETQVFEDENHGSVSPAAYCRGLRVLYE